MDSVEICYTDQMRVSCDGGGGVMGHPVVYLNLSREGMCECPYCGRRYIFDPRGTQSEKQTGQKKTTSS